MPTSWPDIGLDPEQWRLAATFVIFCLVATWETVRPFREPAVSTGKRWTGHFALFFTTSWLIALLVPMSAIATAVAAEDAPYGLLNKTWVPVWAAWLVAILALDFVRYAQHWLLHRIPLLWRLHQVHHADPDYDLTTGLRFHPVEAFFTLSTQCAVIAVLAPPPMAVLVGELIFITQVQLVHGNLAYPEPVDRALRLLLVTPDVHAIHHAVDVEDQNRNFGGVFSIWDRLCRTLREQDAEQRRTMPMGLEGFEGERGVRFATLFLLPFQRQQRPSAYPISSRSRPAASSQPPPVRGS